MKIVVYSAQTKNSIAANIGANDYSYYFVLEKYCDVLQPFATVVSVENPVQEVDAIYHECRDRGEFCLFLSFTPPFKTATELQCPTISVFAWEYLTVPTDVWGGDSRNDWRTVFRKNGCAITHSNFSVRAVRKAMGDDFPVWSIPAPVWNDYTTLYRKSKIVSFQSSAVNFSFRGVLLDFRGCVMHSDGAADRVDFIEKRSPKEGDEKISVGLKGIIYTAVFNPNDGRKNWMDLLWGFCWAFRDVEDVTLVMKLAYHDYETVRPMILHEVKKLAPFKCRVVALHGYLNHHTYTRLIRQSTYIVNSSHGEGQCLPLMEFMSAGKPAVAPAHTAMEDYIDKDNAFIVDSSLEWIPWPHDPRHVLRTFRYRINWESLYHAYLESYRVAKKDPYRYARMADHSVEAMKRYCSKAVVETCLKDVLRHWGATDNELTMPVYKKIANKCKRLKQSLKVFIKIVFMLVLNRVRTHPKLRLFVRKAVSILRLDPIVQSLLQRLRMGAAKPVVGPMDEARLSPHAHRIYLDLKQTIEWLHQERD